MHGPLPKTWDSAARRRSSAQSAGFTLVELVVASLLAVILLTAIAGLLRAVWRQDRRSQQIAARHPQTKYLAAQLQRDFQNAREFSAQSGLVRLAGFNATDPLTLLPSLSPAVVIYRIVGPVDNMLLIRSEVRTDGPLQRTKNDIVWIGASGIEVFHSTLAAVDEDSQVERSPGMRHMPRQLTVVIRGPRGGAICTAEVIHRTSN